MNRRRITMRRAAAAIFIGLLTAGCGTSATETGYEPRRLGLGDAQRRGLYAPKYSPEQAKAEAEREQQGRRTPGIGAAGPGPGANQ
jgi:hypothetical protein